LVGNLRAITGDAGFDAAEFGSKPADRPCTQCGASLQAPFTGLSNIVAARPCTPCPPNLRAPFPGLSQLIGGAPEPVAEFAGDGSAGQPDIQAGDFEVLEREHMGRLKSNSLAQDFEREGPV